MQTEFRINRDGFTVKNQAPRTVTDANERFRALLREQDAPEGLRDPCQIFEGVNFNAGDGRIVKPRRFAIEMRGQIVPMGAKFRILCKVPGCVRHVEVKS
jgi:hypothetical protein